MFLSDPLKYILVLFFFQSFMTAASKLVCKHCSLKNTLSSFKNETLTILNEIPNQEVCVWSNNEHTENSVSDLVKSFALKYKTVARFNSENIISLPDSCLYNIIILHNLFSCGELLSRGLKLTAEHHFFILVEKKSKLGVTELTKCSEQFQSARVVFIFWEDGQVFSLSSPLYLPRQFTLTDLTSVLQPVDLHPRQLNGRPINVASFNCSPFVIFDKDNNTEKITGIEWEVMKEMSSLLNFTVNFAKLKGNGKWGAYINGSWNGGISLALVDGAAEIGVCNIWNTLRYYYIMDFGPPVNAVTFTFIVPRPRLIQHRWQSLVNIFNWEVWLCTITVFLICTLCYWFFCNVYSYKTVVNPSGSMLTMFGILTLTSWAIKTPNSSARQLVTWWCLFVLMLTATYNSSIAARLTLPRYEARIDTVTQLVKQNFHWYDTNYTTHDKKSIYFNLANFWQREWECRYVFVPTHRVLSALKSRKVAFPIQRLGTDLVYFSLDGLDYERDLEDMRVVKETTSDTYVSFGFAKRTPLYQMFQRTLLRLHQTGLVNYWTRDVVHKHGERYAKQLLQETDVVDMGQLKQLAMHNLTPAFFILAVGLLITLGIFLIELFLSKFSRRNIIPFIN